MPDPINSASTLAYSYAEEPEEPELTCHSPPPGGAPREASGGAPGRAPEAPSKDAPRSCVAPALKAVATCGGIALSQGVGVLVAGATCVASLIELDDCLAAQRARSRQ
jgi:hypothetical protein